MTRNAIALFVCTTVTLLLVACGGTSRAGAGPTPVGGATLTVNVMSGSGPVADADTSLSGPVSQQTKTSASGQATFASIPAGAYTVFVHGFGIQDAQQAVSVDNAPQQVTVNALGKDDVALVAVPSQCGTTVPFSASIPITAQYNLTTVVHNHLVFVQSGLSADGSTVIPESQSGITVAQATGTVHYSFNVNSRMTAHYLITRIVAGDIIRPSLDLVVSDVLATQVTPCDVAVQ